jgi:hypothetical protein
MHICASSCVSVHVLSHIDYILDIYVHALYHLSHLL